MPETAHRKAFSVRFKALDRWSVAYFRSVNWQWPKKYIHPIGEAINRVQELVQYSPIDTPIIEKISFGGKLSILERDKRSGYKGRLFKAKSGQLIYSKIRVKQGSVCVIPSSVNWVAVSSEYPVYEINSDIADAAYLEIVLRSSSFKHYLEGISHGGSTKTRIHPDQFETLSIPIPPLSVQQKIVMYWKADTAEVSQLKDQAKAIIDKSTRTFIHELGLSIPKKQALEKVFITRWGAFDRWSVSYNQATKTMLDLSKGKFPVVELGSILELVQYGTSEKSNTDRTGVPILRINNIKKGYVDTTDLKHISLGNKTLENLALVDGDILIIRTSGSRDLVGTCAVFHEKDKFVYASYLIRLKVSHQKTLSDYVSSYINSPVGRQQVNLLSRQIMQNNINSQEIRSLKIPLPPLPLQKEIVQDINYAHQEAALLERGAKDRLEKATIGIEQMILGTRPVGAH
jgi:type I restriction enzyme S subunit